MTQQRHRGDIQGLRGISVLAVLLYHANSAWLPGGFLGVDVFFVISGFLITGLLIQGAPLQEFYRRRILRILPTYALVSALVLIGGVLLFLPSDLKTLSTSMKFSALFAANVFFSREKSYFEPAIELQPLLHYWSLAIEEQFYIIWPFAFGLMRRFLKKPRSLFLITSELALIGLLFSWQQAQSRSSDTYFLFSVRFAEPLMGAALATWWEFRKASPLGAASSHRTTIAGVFAFLMLAFGFAFLDAQSFLPGVGALPVLIGSCMLLLLGAVWPDNVASRLLSCRALQYAGRISYPLYMLHWPIFAFLRYTGFGLHGAVLAAALILAFGSAVVVNRLVEEPLRHLSWSLPRAFACFFLMPAIVCFFADGIVVTTDGLSRRAPEAAIQEIAIQNRFAHVIRKGCHEDSPAIDLTARCVLGENTQVPSAILWGDSFANHYSGFVDVLARRERVAVRDITANSCPPIVGLASLRSVCSNRNQAVVRYLGEHPEIKVVYLAAAWSGFLGGKGGGADADLEKTVAMITALGKKPIILAEPPELPTSKIDCPSKRAFYASFFSMDCDFPLQSHARLLEDLAKTGARVIDPIPLLCDGARCRQESGGLPVYRAGDASHLNFTGSEALGRAYLEQKSRSGQ